MYSEVLELFGKYNDKLVGMVMTMIEASMPDKPQQDAVKMVLKTLMYDARDVAFQQLKVLLEEYKE